MPPVLLTWLSKIDIYHSSAIGSSKQQTRTNDDKTDVPVLLTSHWHQSAPYNDLAPIIVDGNVKTAAGCVAVASAQIVYYWRKDNPSETSYDTPIYPYGKAPVTYSIPAGTAMDWDLMRDSYTLQEPQEDRNAVARLVYLLGTSTYLQYGVSTGGHIQDILNPIYKQFRLKGTHAIKSKFSQEEWEDLLYYNLQKGYPILYAGSTGNSGHAVVIDGYRADLNLFHFNFGWGGSGDGYYTVNDDTGMDGYNEDQSCVYGICPIKRNITTIVNYPNEMYEDQEATVTFSLSNKSTLDVHDLYLFVSKNTSAPTDIEKAQAHVSINIPNDGTEYAVSLSFTPGVYGNRCVFCLTDGDLNVLSTVAASVQQSETNIASVEQQDDLRLYKDGTELLVVQASCPTQVKIYNCMGEIVFSSLIDGVVEIPLSHGIYFINQKKWLQ